MSDKMEDGTHVRVAVRCRPMSQKEIADGYKAIVEFEAGNKVVVHDPSESPSDQLGTRSGERQNYSQVYGFNAVFDQSSSQKEVYESVCQDIVGSVLDGYNGTIFAYGQTGTGKTYTMEGNSNQLVGWRATKTSKLRKNSTQSGDSSNNSELQGNETRRASASADKSALDNFEESMGIIPRAFRQIFEHVGRAKDVQFLIRAAYLEIYQEEIHDLLRKDRSVKLELHERPDIGVYVKDLTWYVCKSITEIERVMRVGNQNRMVGATDMNEHSSRSHAIFMITIEQQLAPSNSLNSMDKKGQNLMGSGGQVNGLSKSQSKDRVIRVGKLNLVDLAGSERQRKTNSSGQRQRESIKINLSLSALGNVINSLMKINTNQQLKQQQQQQQIEKQSTKTSYNNVANQRPINHNKGNNNQDTTNGHIPYRDSKLTRLLQDSLGGNARTLMITNIGPASYNYDETINTLNYASRAKCIKNRPRLNEDPKDALLRELQREIEELRNKVANFRPALASKPKSSGQRPEASQAPDKQQVERELFELRRKLASLEAKLLNGVPLLASDRANMDRAVEPASVDLKGYTRVQEQRLEASRAELLDQANRERDMRQELERREELELLAKQSFSSVQQEVEAKRKLIRQILLKIQSIKSQLLSSREAQRVELDELEQLQFVLQRELKLKALIMDNFVPSEHVEQLLARITYDERQDACQLADRELPAKLSEPDDGQEDQCTCFASASACSPSLELIWAEISKSTGGLRAGCEFEKISDTIYPGNIRYKSDRFVEPRLEIPEQPQIRRFADTDDGMMNEDSSNNLQRLLDDALAEVEPDVMV